MYGRCLLTYMLVYTQIWVTAIKQGRRANICFWPGSEAAIQGVRPSFWLPYTRAANMSSMDRVQMVLSWYPHNASVNGTGGANTTDSWPDLGAIYFSLADERGHASGPDSPAVNASISELDQALGHLLRHLDPRVTVLIVSDHGMTALDQARKTVFLDDFVNVTRLELVDFSPVVSIRPTDESGSCASVSLFMIRTHSAY